MVQHEYIKRSDVGSFLFLSCGLSNFMGDAMNPLSPNQILRNLENGFFMTHREQEEAAQYIRQLQQENLALLGKREWVGLTDDEINDFDRKLRDNGDYCSLHFAWGISAKLKEKNT